MPRVIRTRIADENHVVTTIESSPSERGDGPINMKRPCKDCPWRKDAVGGFPAEAFRHSASTAYDGAMSSFACHQAGAEKAKTCAGFLLKNADHNFQVRISQMSGRIGPVSDGGLELFDSYREMAIANGVDPSDPVLAMCRSNCE